MVGGMIGATSPDLRNKPRHSRAFDGTGSPADVPSAPASVAAHPVPHDRDPGPLRWGCNPGVAGDRKERCRSGRTTPAGAVGRGARNLTATTEFQRFQLEAAYLTLTSNVVAAAVQEASLRGQISATEEIIKIETQSLGILRKQL